MRGAVWIAVTPHYPVNSIRGQRKILSQGQLDVLFVCNRKVSAIVIQLEIDYPNLTETRALHLQSSGIAKHHSRSQQTSSWTRRGVAEGGKKD